jgi:dTDP-4-dehydrorhamnose reductase
MGKILITGSNGFLGSRLCKYLSANHRVIAPLHSEMDFTDIGQVADIFQKETPVLVIHCGAVSDIKTCEKDQDFSHRINVVGTENIAKICHEYHSKMIFCSSDQIYFQKSGMEKHTEDEKVNPANVYGKQKLEAEEICFRLCSDAVCLRLTWMYDFMNYHKNEHKDLFRNIVTAVENGNRISYPVFDYRGITYVQYVLENIEKAFSLPGGIYNFGSENDKNTYETVKAVLNFVGESNYDITPNTEAFSDHPRNIKMDNSKLKHFRIEFPNTIQGLKECAIQYNNCRNKV